MKTNPMFLLFLVPVNTHHLIHLAMRNIDFGTDDNHNSKDPLWFLVCSDCKIFKSHKRRCDIGAQNLESSLGSKITQITGNEGFWP